MRSAQDTLTSSDWKVEHHLYQTGPEKRSTVPWVLRKQGLLLELPSYICEELGKEGLTRSWSQQPVNLRNPDPRLRRGSREEGDRKTLPLHSYCLCRFQSVSAGGLGSCSSAAGKRSRAWTSWNWPGPSASVHH